jgi:hypothetical protein
LHELFQVIRILKLIKSGKLIVEPLEGYRLSVLDGGWLHQRFDFGRRHIPASVDVGDRMNRGCDH